MGNPPVPFSAAREDCFSTARPGNQRGADKAAPPPKPASSAAGPVRLDLPLRALTAPATHTTVPTATPRNTRLSGKPS